MEPLLLATIFISFICTYFSMPYWIRKAKQVGLIWEDMHKVGHPKNVVGSGGIMVLFGFVLGVLLYIAIKTFYFGDNTDSTLIFALLSSILIIGLIGMLDDILGWKRGGSSKKSRLILLFFAAIPLMVLNVGESTMMGIQFGILFPLIIVPLGIVGATSTFNFLAGYNGLEAGQGIIILSALSVVTYLTGNSWLSIVALCMVGALVAFYIFNKCPAKAFPGDILTYSVGGLIAIIAILGNIEKIAIFFFIPYIIEVVLKARGKLKKESFGKLNLDGSLEMPYKKIYGLEHLSILILKKIKPSKKVYESEVTYLIHFFQIIIVVLGFLFIL